jgi:hypothetical protein
MNRYGMVAMAHWRRYAPTRLAALDDPEAFFTDLGNQVAAQVSDLAAILGTEGSSEQTYWQQVARMVSARQLAEEVVMGNLVWVHDPELPLDQAREEWEQTRPSDESLVTWAERMQDAPDLMPSTAELEDMAQEWALPVKFLQEMVASEPPRDYWRANQGVLAEAATIRFLRELR